MKWNEYLHQAEDALESLRWIEDHLIKNGEPVETIEESEISRRIDDIDEALESFAVAAKFHALEIDRKEKEDDDPKLNTSRKVVLALCAIMGFFGLIHFVSLAFEALERFIF